MILADFRSDCFRTLENMSLDESYHARLTEEFKILESQADDYKGSIVDYFLGMVDHVKKNGKVPNTNNMLLSFILGISDEDPIKKDHELIKTKSAEFPDIDMDFEDSKRDLVKEYVVKKYGRENVASIAAFGRMQAKAVIKDVARVKNIPFEEVNEVTKLIDFNEDLEKAYKEKEVVRDFFQRYDHMDLYKICSALEGNVRHLSQHAAGVVITPKAVSEFCGLEKAKDNFVTCFEEAGGSKELSKLGLVKMDFLGLNTLTIIHEALNNVQKNHGIDIDFKSIKNINFDDPEILREFSLGNTVGIFQFERTWVQDMLKKMRNVTFRDIAVLNALNRPGPIEMGEKLWKTKVGEMPNTYLHPWLESILGESYGVICYQEQGMAIAQKLANFSADEADSLRKGMSSGKSDLAKGINPFTKWEKRFLEGCHRNGIHDRINVSRWIDRDIDMALSTSMTAQDVVVTGEEREDKGVHEKQIKCNVEVGDEIFWQIRKFAEYGFNKSHAVEYSMDAAMAMYLKHYYPTEFMASLLSNTPNAVSQMDHSNKFVDYFNEAKRMGIKIIAPNINLSHDRFTPTKDGIISGFNFIKDLGTAAYADIAAKRPFKNFDEFLMKMSGKAINKSSMYALVYSGCFDDFLPYGANGKPDLSKRFDFLERYRNVKKIKDKEIPTSTSTMDAVLLESDSCGDQLFHNLVDLVDINTVNKSFGVDDQMRPFTDLDRINVGTVIRVFGVIQSWYVKRNPQENKAIGFLALKNGAKTHRFMAWNKDVIKIDRDRNLQEVFKAKNLVTLRVKRDRNYKDMKSFVVDLEKIQQITIPKD